MDNTSQPMLCRLPVTPQADGHSCGILADNALRHYVSPVDNPLLATGAADVIAQRLKLFNEVAQNIVARVRTKNPGLADIY